MPLSTPRRGDAMAAMAGYLAAKRARPGDDMDALTAECLREVETDPYYEAILCIAESAPPPDTWDEDTARQLRRILRGTRNTA
jgi:hypothetical protein